MKTIVLLLVMIFLVAASAPPAFCGSYGHVTTTELKAMMDRNEPGLVIIDSRQADQYAEEHIKGAINIPLAEMEQNQALPDLPKAARLVFYCSGMT